MPKSGPKSGLWIGGEKIERSDAHSISILKFLIVPEASWDEPAFRSHDLDQIMELADALSVDIVLAMIDDYLAHEFAARDNALQNIALRKGVIAAMRSICAGDIDGDYREAVVGVPPTLGYLQTLEVLWAPGAETGAGVLTRPLPYQVPDTGWVHLDTGSPWTGFVFVQKQGVALSESMMAIQPFRGECAGALQLSILHGALAALGAGKVDALEDHFGPAFVGAWNATDKVTGKKVPTAATRFLTQLHDVPKDYERGSVLGVPGDYFYFENKDDYADLAKDGGWQGENCIYMGQDALGAPHYSGLGLAWKSEFALRMFLGNAYVADCNKAYLNALRGGHKPPYPLRIVDDPIAQVRFTARAVMRYPELGTGPAPELDVAGAAPPTLTDEEIVQKLTGVLGFRRDDSDTYKKERLQLGKLIDVFGLFESAIQQSPSARMNSVDLCVNVGAWVLTMSPCEESSAHPSMNDDVSVVACRFEASQNP